MEDLQRMITPFIDQAGWFGPLLFILLHLVRPFLFLPVIVVCIIGGFLFGFVHGTIYSIIGLSLMSAVFYKLIEKFPRFQKKFAKLKKRVFNDRKITVGQVMILRMMPFVHFHLLSLYLIEMSKNYKDYLVYAVGGVILPSAIYTAFGQSLTELPWYGSVLFFLVLLAVFAYLGKKDRVSTFYKWERYYQKLFARSS